MSRYKNSHYGKCEYCANEGTGCCSDCEHAEHDYEDYWEEDTPEAVAEREKAELEKAIKEAIVEYVELEIPEGLKQTFNIAKKCAAVNHFRRVFMGVYMTKDGYMVASDTHLLYKIKCDCIPECLKGRAVITLEDGKAGLNHGEYPDFNAVLNVTGYENMLFSQVNRKYERKDPDNSRDVDKVFLSIENTIVLFDDAKLSKVEDVLQGEITIFYKPGDANVPLFFKGSNGEMAVVPMRSNF